METTCPFANNHISSVFMEKSHYDDYIGMCFFEKAFAQWLTSAEHMFFAIHGNCESLFAGIEKIVLEIYTREEPPTVKEFLSTIEKIISSSKLINKTVAAIKNVLQKEEFQMIRGGFGTASGFQSGYHRVEYSLTRSDILNNENGIPYWQISSVGEKSLSEMLVRFDYVGKASKMIGKNIADIYLSNPHLHTDSIKARLIKIDTEFNLNFKKTHLAVAEYFIGQIDHKGTAESEFRKYLSSSKKIRLYPFLYNHLKK
ncbi:MAG: hypothetical protein ABIT05_12665 [Chitinophagaceae bacterium]